MWGHEFFHPSYRSYCELKHTLNNVLEDILYFSHLALILKEQNTYTAVLINSIVFKAKLPHNILA